MEMELRELSAALPALDTLSIISEQSQVVSRILNDVLSMQKIEDGALTLEYDVFSMEKMIRGSLYAFRSPCMDKRIKVKVDLASIDDLISQALPAFRIGEVIVPLDELLESDDPMVTFDHDDATSGNTDPIKHNRQQSGGSIAAEMLQSVLSKASSTSTPHGRSRNSYIHRAYVRGDPYRLRQVFSNLITNGE